MISHAILDNMLYLPRRDLSEQQIGYLKNNLSISNKFNADEVLLLFDDTKKDYFGVPMYYWKHHDSNIAQKIIDRRIEGTEIKFSMKSTPLVDQARILTQFKASLKDGVTGFILNAPPGWGKTRTIAELIQIIGRNALVVVPTKDLVGQWVERILEHTTLKEEDIGIFSDGKANYSKEKKITIGLVHTLALERFHKYSKDFGVVCFDEVHMSVPPRTFAPVAQMYSPKYRIGASATLKRDDWFDAAFTHHVEQVRLKGDATTNRMGATVYLVDYPKSSGNIPAYALGDKIKTRATAISLFAKNRERTHCLAAMAAQSQKSGRRTCVISDRTSILVDLYNILKDNHGYDSSELGYFCSSLTSSEGVAIRSGPKSERVKTLAEAKIILSTYGLMSTGVDLKDLAVIILATPQSKVTQTKGRVERVCDGKKSPLVFDFLDSYYQSAKLWLTKRVKEYQASEMEIKKVSYRAFMKGK